MSVVFLPPANSWQSKRAKTVAVNGRRVAVHSCDTCQREAPFDASAGWRRASEPFDFRSYCSDRCQALAHEQPGTAKCGGAS